MGMRFKLPSTQEEVELYFEYKNELHKWMEDGVEQEQECTRTYVTLHSTGILGLDNFTITTSALCGPYDQFRKAEGRKIAVVRLLAKFPNRDDRKAIGEAYFTRNRG